MAGTVTRRDVPRIVGARIGPARDRELGEAAMIVILEIADTDDVGVIREVVYGCTPEVGAGLGELLLQIAQGDPL